MSSPFCLTSTTTYEGFDRDELEKLLAELQGLQTQRVYKRTVHFLDEAASGATRRCTLSTTNEKIFLALGKLTDYGLVILTDLLIALTKEHGERLFTFDPPDRASRQFFLYVTRTDDPISTDPILHLSLGH